MKATLDNSKGFEIALNLRGHVLRTRIWGIWDMDFAKKYKHALNEKMDEIRTRNNQWNIVMDFSQCSSLPDNVRNMIAEQIAEAKTHGLHDVVYVPESLTNPLPVHHITN